MNILLNPGGNGPPQAKTVFLIDDDPIALLITERIVTNCLDPQQVLAFEDAEYALNHLVTLCPCSQELPDLIFLDLNMPIMDGWEFMEDFNHLKASMNKDIRIVVVTSSTARSERERARKLGAYAFISKPFEPHHLYELGLQMPLHHHGYRGAA